MKILFGMEKINLSITRYNIVNFPLWLLHISLYISYKNLMLDQDQLPLYTFQYSHYQFAGYYR